jgi:hypothetical protein
MKARTRNLAIATLLGAGLLTAPALAQAPSSNINCTMGFGVTGWSVFYKKADGTGNVSCSNGQRAQVKIHVSGGGLSFGKSDLQGTGTFSVVRDISEIYGAYASTAAHAGAVKSGEAQAMTKGPVSLSLTGTGRGFDVGFYFGKFVIEPIGK